MEKIRAIKHRWSLTAERGLNKTFRSDLSRIRGEVKTGRSELWHWVASQIDLWTVLRREGSELVVVCVQGKGVRQVVPIIEQAAENSGIKTMRAHTQRPALHRIFRRDGWTLRHFNETTNDYIFQKVLIE